MIYPIVAYGDPVLKKRAKDIPEDYEGLQQLIDDMFETMYNAPGVGLAAPQIGKSLRLFVVDSEQVFADMEEQDKKEWNNEEGIKRAFINPTILEEFGEPWDYEEGCLSIPGIREDVNREDSIVIEYYDTDFNRYEEEFTGLTARIIQHEYDHVDGILFTDHLKPLKKRLLKRRLDKISKGTVEVDYKMRFPLLKKAR